MGGRAGGRGAREPAGAPRPRLVPPAPPLVSAGWPLGVLLRPLSRLYAAATAIRDATGAGRAPVDYGQYESELAAARDAALDAGVHLSENLTGGVFVNQTAAFSDLHGTGANPAANATLTDSAYVANRFRVVQSRRPA